MQIIFLSPHCDPQARPGEPDAGGQCVYEHNLALALSQIEGVAMTTFCRKKSGYPELSSINASYQIKRIVCGGSESFIPKEQIEAVLPEFVDKVAAQTSPQSTTVVHAHYWDGAKAALMLKRKTTYDFPLIWTPHSLGSLKRARFPGLAHEMTFNFIPRQTWENYGMLLSDATLVSTHSEKEEIIRAYLIDPGTIQVISPGVNLDREHQVEQGAARRSIGLPDDGPICLALGRLTREKGYHHAIRAFALLKQHTGLPLRLAIFAGSAGALSAGESAYLEELVTLAEALNLGDSVLFRRSVDRALVGSVYNACDVFFNLAEYEPFGLSILEAMSMGIPVIATKNGGPEDIITHAVNGFLYDSTAYDQIAETAACLLEDRVLRDSIIGGAREQIEANYRWTTTANKTYRLYEKLAAGRRSADDLALIDSNYFLDRNL